MTKKISLAFLWFISILATADLTAYVTNNPTWVWETKPWARRIKHWPEPVVALAGDMPIYQSDLRNAFENLPPQVQNAQRKSKASETLLNETVTPLLWRVAAQSSGILESTSTFKLMEGFKNSLLKPWIDKQTLRAEYRARRKPRFDLLSLKIQTRSCGVSSIIAKIVFVVQFPQSRHTQC